MEKDEKIELMLELREQEGLNRKEFALKYGIPYPTITDWEMGHRRIPEYFLRLLAYKVGIESINKSKASDLRLRPYKSCDADKIISWVKDEDTFHKWGGDHFGRFPIDATVIDNKYMKDNGDCIENDNFYPWVAFTDEDGIVGHFIMRYTQGNNKRLRFGWVIVDDSIRGKGYGTKMLRSGLDYAFRILGVDTVTIGVLENNDIAHNCYKRVGFVDKETVHEGRDNIIEMEISKTNMKGHDLYGERTDY